MSVARSYPTDAGFRPLQDNILVRRRPAELVTAGGVMLPETVRETLDRGCVVAVGPGRRTPAGTFIPASVAPGDEVALTPASGVAVTVAGEQLVVVNERDVLGVFVSPVREVESVSGADEFAEPAHVLTAAGQEESLETDVAPDLLDREAPTAEDLH